MRIIRWSVDNAPPIAALWLGVFVLALLALQTKVPTRLTPYVQSPMLAVVTNAEGLPAEEVETAISTPLETRLANTADVRYVRSMSMQGMSVITLEFPYGQDMQRALQEVRSCLTDVVARLGLDVRRGELPRVLPFDPLNLPVLRLALTNNNLDPEDLRAFARDTVAPRLKSIAGVASVDVVGGARRQVDIGVDRDRLSAFGLSMLDVRRAIETARVGMSGSVLMSVLGQMPVRLAPDARLSDIVVASVGGRHVLLKDVATVSNEAIFDTHAGHLMNMAPETLYRLNGRDAVEVNVVASGDASSPRVIAAVRAQMSDVERLHPDLGVDEAYENAHFVEIMKRDVVADLVMAVLLTGLVVFVFLGDVRGTFIALITIPVSLGCAVLLFVPLGLSLNSSSLVGLLLAIGRLVDDAIVDLSSVHRHLRLGKSAREAAIDGCSEVRRAVIAATVILCVALLPLTVCGGLTQDMFVGIVWPFLLSLLASLGVALTLTPMLASIAYRNVRPRHPARWLQWLQGLEHGYGRVLAWALRHRGVVMCAALGACYLAAMLYPLIGSEMMPMADIGQAYGLIEARPGTSMAELSRVVEQVERLLLRHKEVLKVSTEVGAEHTGESFTGYDMGGMDTARLMITMTDRDSGRAPIWDILDEVRKQASDTIPDLRRLTLKEMGSDVMASAMAPIEVLIYGTDLQRLSWLSEAVARMGRDTHLQGVGTAWSWGQPEIRVHVDARKAADLGLSPLAVVEQAYYALNGGAVESPSTADRVMLAYREDERRGFDDLRNVLIVGEGGRSAPLRTLAVVERGEGPQTIMHDSLRRANSVSAYYRPGGTGSMPLTMDLMMKAAMNLPFPPGYGLEQRGDMTQMMDAFSRLLRGLGLALILIYVSLVVQFRSLTVPLTLMAAIPLELTGVFLALIIAHQTFSTVSLLGLVVLNGMDVTASILIVDRILQLRADDRLRRADAVLEGGRTRLLPVLMTVGVTLAVMGPLALHPPAGLDAYAPLATVIVGGLVMCTPLTLLVIPVLYTILDDLARWGPGGGIAR